MKQNDVDRVLKSLTNMKNIELETIVREEIIGGFILQTSENW